MERENYLTKCYTLKKKKQNKTKNAVVRKLKLELIIFTYFFKVSNTKIY